jgi:hypothetical protein
MATDDRHVVQDYTRNKRRAVVGLFIYGWVFGIVSCLAGDENRGVNFVLAMPFVVLLVSWCTYDAAERGDRISRPMMIGLIFVALPALFVYLLGTRGFREFRSIVLASLVVLGLVLTVCITAGVTGFIGEVTGWWSVPE